MTFCFNVYLYLFLGCRDRYWTSSWRSDQHTQNQRTFWEGHWKPATHVNQQTWQISWYSSGSEGLCASLEGWLWVFSPLNILDPKSGLFYSSAKFSFVSNTNFPSTVETGMVLWDSNVDVLCKDSRITFSYGRK